MPGEELPALSLAEWMVLCVVCEGPPVHGFAVAAPLGPDGDLGKTQQAELAPVAAALSAQLRSAQGFDQVLPLWRHETTSASLHFLNAVAEQG
jgi:hypothetical protein